MCAFKGSPVFPWSSYKVLVVHLSSKLKIRMTFKSLVPVMTNFIKIQKTKKHFFTPDQKRVKTLKRSIEAVAWRWSVKKAFLKILQNSPKYNCAGVTF